MNPRRILRLATAGWVVCAMALTAFAGPGGTVDRYLLLNNGRLMAGHIEQNGQGYLIIGSHGRIQVPYEQVKLVSDSLQEMYRAQRDARPNPVTPRDRITLAQWCISYSLYDEARLEMKHLLRSDPNNEEARQLLKKLAEVLKPDRPESFPAPLRTTDGYLVPAAESLGSLSRETAVQFTSRVQPILVNKCGNARCHGPANEETFRLIHVRANVNAHRLHTERNLATLAPYINLERPADSKLLTVPAGNHGGGAVSVFGGPGGDRQLEILRAWVYDVARDRGGYNEEAAREAAALAAEEARSLPDVTTAGAEDSESAMDRVVNAALSETPAESSDKQPAATLEPARSRDPFDPEIFNALVHGGVAPRSRPQ